MQFNTTVGRHIAELLSRHGTVLWSVFFIVPTGRAKAEQRLSAAEVDRAFGELYRLLKPHPFPIKTTEAPHYHRVLASRASEGQSGRH